MLGTGSVRCSAACALRCCNDIILPCSPSQNTTKSCCRWLCRGCRCACCRNDVVPLYCYRYCYRHNHCHPAATAAAVATTKMPCPGWWLHDPLLSGRHGHNRSRVYHIGLRICPWFSSVVLSPNLQATMFLEGREGKHVVNVGRVVYVASWG